MTVPRRRGSATLCASLLAALVFAALPSVLAAQGETTAAILGEVTDATSAAIPGAEVTVTNHDTGLKRTALTDAAGRFDLPQLPPGTYSVEASASGFETSTNPSVVAGLGQKQTVNLTLRVAASKQTVEVSAEASIVNPANANTSTTLNARALENLPNPGGDLTYPLQFTPGALMNTAGSGNDFVGSSNGYGNVEFNGLPALSNGYIVDGLETNDPLTNLNSGLSTNLVLGLNSIAEVTVNTLSYSVDQGRYGASQVNYVTKSGANQFHGNLYELWNGAVLNADDYFANSSSETRKPRSTLNHFGGSIGGPIVHDKLFFFFDSEWVRIALPIFNTVTVPSPAFQQYVLAQLPLGGTDSVTGTAYPAAPQLVPFYQKMFSLYGNTSGTPLAILGCPFNGDGSTASGIATERRRLREPARRVAFKRRSRAGADRAHRLERRPERHGVVSLSGRHRIAGRLYRSDQSAVRRALAAAAVFLRGGLHAHFLAERGELFQSRIFLVFQHLRSERFPANARRVSDRASGQRRGRSLHHHRRTGQYLDARPAGGSILHQRQSGVEPWRTRIALRHQHADIPSE